MGLKENLNNIFWCTMSASASMFIALLSMFMYGAYLETVTVLTPAGIYIMRVIGVPGTMGLFLYLFSITTSHFEDRMILTK